MREDLSKSLHFSSKFSKFGMLLKEKYKHKDLGRFHGCLGHPKGRPAFFGNATLLFDVLCFTLNPNSWFMRKNKRAVFIRKKERPPKRRPFLVIAKAVAVIVPPILAIASFMHDVSRVTVCWII